MSDTNTHNELQHIAIEKLVRGRYQPRRQFDQDQLVELAAAIKTTDGLLQPILVRKSTDNNTYEIIAGERRWRAAMMAGLASVSCIVKNYSDQEALAAAIIENVSRTDLNPLEEAFAYQRLASEFGYSHEEIAHSVGKSRPAITNTLRLLKLDARVQEYLIAGSLSEGHGKILANLPHARQIELAEQCIQHGWSVRQIEKKVRQLLTHPNLQASKDSNIAALEHALSDHLGCRVKIDSDNQQGTLKVYFHNLDVLEGLFTKMGFTFNSTV